MVRLTKTTCVLVAAMSVAGEAGARPRRPVEKVVDEGTFVVTVAGQRAGQEAFSIVELGREREIRTTTVLGGTGGPTRLRGTLRTDDRWHALNGRFELQVRGGGKRMTLERTGELPELVTQVGARSVVKTRPGRASDVFVLTQSTVVAHFAPLCQLAGPREQTLTAFPAAALRLSAAALRPYPQNRTGAPLLELRTVTVDLAQSMRFELVCDGTRLLALHQRGRELTAVRASYEAVAATLDARRIGKPMLPETIVDLPRRVTVSGAAPLACGLMGPRAALEAKPPAAPGALVFNSPAEPRPGVVLLGDAGTQDRDGDPVGPGDPSLSLLKRLALRLAEGGIVSLRCDDRPRSSGTLPALAIDVRAVLAALRKERAVDPARTGLLGYGEGALVAALVAERDPKVRAVSLLAAAGRPLDEVVLAESEATLRRFGYPEPEIAAAIAEQQATYRALRAGARLPATLSPAGRSAIREARPWLRSHLAVDPAVVVGRLKAAPVMLIQGEKDARLSPADFERLRAALVQAGNPRVTARLYPALSHPFAPAKTGSLTDHLASDAETSDEVLRDVLGFFREALVGPLSLGGPFATVAR